jgi:hypothetical protein
MSEPTMTFEGFILLLQRAGLTLSRQDAGALFDEIATSCGIVEGMAARIEARLTAECEPAHIFHREAADVAR